MLIDKRLIPTIFKPFNKKTFSNQLKTRIMNRIFLAILFFAVFLFKCHGQSRSAASEVEIGVIEMLGDTIPLELTFINETNDTVSLGMLINKPTILNFVYFDCPGVCSPSLVGMEDVASKLDLVLGKDYQIITISFNVRDTPEKAREMKTNFIQKIGEPHRHGWMYLTGSQESIDIITGAVGYKYKPAGLDWNHPSVIVFISPGGVITRYLYGLSFLPFNVKMALTEAAEGRIGSSVNKLLEVCFTFDPESRTYTLKTTTIIGGIIIFLAAILLITLLVMGRKKK